MRYSLLALLLAVSFSALADTTAVSTWDAPYTRVDGSLLLESEIDYYTLNHNDTYYPVTGKSYELILPDASNTFSVKATDVYGVESLPSNVVVVNTSPLSAPVIKVVIEIVQSVQQVAQ